jgi:pimeloyl-ACP methyl ester carboxylesterase
MGPTVASKIARPARRRRGVRRALIGGALTVAVLSAAGAGYETIAGSGDAERYPMPGQLVDIGGHRLHLSCLGEGSPTVILDAGLGGTSRDWVLVQARLSAQTRVCAYDRAGMGRGEAGPGPRSPARFADELHRLLTNAGIPGPYVLVVHSLSGKSARLFAAAHPEDVAGMVLVDTRSEQIDAATPAAEAEAFTAALKRQAVLLSLARKLGLVRLMGSRTVGEPTLPPDVATELALLQTQPESLPAPNDEGLARATDDAAPGDLAEADPAGRDRGGRQHGGHPRLGGGAGGPCGVECRGSAGRGRGQFASGADRTARGCHRCRPLGAWDGSCR